MLPLFVIAAVTTVGGFSYKTVILSERVKHVSSAPEGYPGTWEEHVDAVVGTSLSDRDFNAYMKRRAVEMQENYYRDDSTPHGTFETYAVAGYVDIGEAIIASSPDLVSVTTGTSLNESGMTHPQGQDVKNIIWSRRLHRPLAEADVFLRAPDRAMRRMAQSRFDNREGLTNPDGLPLSWDEASIGPDGITWSFSPYELGGYLSGGNATIPWVALKPYLRADLPFSIKSIRYAPDQRLGDQMPAHRHEAAGQPEASNSCADAGELNLRVTVSR